MELHAKQSLYRTHGISNAALHRGSWLYRVRRALAALGRMAAEIHRTRRDHDCQLRMTESQLRDIGLCRIESAVGVHIVPLGDAGSWPC
jgi:uncharacterized protein YjiS (DUF1127 family)